MSKLLYKPLGSAAGVLAGLVAGMLVKQVWKVATGETDAPSAKDADKSWPEILAAAALQGAIFALVKAAADRGTAVGFRRLTGAWPS